MKEGLNLRFPGPDPASAPHRPYPRPHLPDAKGRSAKNIGPGENQSCRDPNPDAVSRCRVMLQQRLQAFLARQACGLQELA